jgi:hypothetical protein
MEWIVKKLKAFIGRLKRLIVACYKGLLKRCSGLFYEDWETTEEELAKCQKMVDEARQRILSQEKENNQSV